MEAADPAKTRLEGLTTPRGLAAGELTVGAWRLRFDGLDAALERVLAARWGGFWRPPGGTPPTLVVTVVRGDGSAWIPAGPPGEAYRLEADGTFVRSYHFAIAPTGPATWRLAVEDAQDEPAGRILDNAARYLVARTVIEAGGLAFHGAAVLRDGRAWIFAGPSRAGKSTAVSLSSPCTSLGDDFAVVVPQSSGWGVAAVPFDNAAAAPEAPVRGYVPLAGLFRLRHDAVPALARPPGALAHASLLSCTAFPWALPDLASRIDDAVDALVASGRYAHLSFAKDASFWTLLEGFD